MTTNEMKLMIYRLIEEAEGMKMGLFTFNDEKNKGFVFDIQNMKMYSVGDFVDVVMHERLRRLTMLER